MDDQQYFDGAEDELPCGRVGDDSRHYIVFPTQFLPISFMMRY